MDAVNSELELHRELERLLARGETVVLATVVRTRGSTPRKAGAKLLILADGTARGTIGGGCLEAEVRERGRALMNQGDPELVSFSLTDAAAADLGLRCGGTMEVFMERITPQPVLYLIGAGHISLALAAVVRPLGFAVHVVDDNPAFANAERFPGATLHLVPFERTGEVVTDGARVAAVVATRGHNQDEVAFLALAGRELGYLGIVSSWKRLVEFYRTLLAQGVPLERLRRIRGPVGLDIGSETPEEIAVAIAAEVLSGFKGGDQRSLAEAFWASPAAARLPQLAAGGD